MQKKTIFTLFAVYISAFLFLTISSFYLLQSVFGVTLFDRSANTVSKQEAKRQIAAYLNEKYNTDLFSSRYISVTKAMVGCGCDIDPMEFVGYTAKIKEIPNSPVSPKTVWMMFSEETDPFLTDDGQLEEVHQAFDSYLKNNRISSDYLLIPSEYGAGFDYGDFSAAEWTPGKGFHAYFDGQNLSAFFDQEQKNRSHFSEQESNTYQYTVYFSIPDSKSKISNEEFYQDMEALKNRFHLSLNAVLMKECFFQQLKDSVSYPSAFTLSPAVYFSAYQNGESYSPVFLDLIPGISLALNEATQTEVSEYNFQLEKVKTPLKIKNFFSQGTKDKIPEDALIDMLQTYTIFCKTAEQSYEKVTLLIDLDQLDFTYTDAGILESEETPPGISTNYYSNSLNFTNGAQTKFQLGRTLVMSTVLFPGKKDMTLTICPDQFLEEGKKSIFTNVQNK